MTDETELEEGIQLEQLPGVETCRLESWGLLDRGGSLVAMNINGNIRYTGLLRVKETDIRGRSVFELDPWPCDVIDGPQPYRFD